MFYVEFEVEMFAGKERRKVTGYCDWMSQLPSELHTIPLWNLAIPGMKLSALLLHSTNQRHSFYSLWGKDIKVAVI